MAIDWKTIASAILNQESAKQYGLRNNGVAKGLGYYGQLPGLGENKGYIMTENSIGINMDGQELEIPTIVPTLSKKELELILSGGMNDSIISKSIEHAKKRLSAGLSPFANPKDIIIPSPKFDKGK